jgi:peroxin-13
MDPPKKPWELDSCTEEIPPRPTAPVDSLNTVNRPINNMGYGGYGSSPYGYNSGYSGYGSNYNTGYGSGYNTGYGGYGSSYGSGYGGYGSGYGGYNNFGYNAGYNRPFDGNSLSSTMEQETQQTFATIQQIVQVCFLCKL